MRKLLIACLNLLLIFNNIGFQAINATEVDIQGEEISETSLQTEETDGSTDTSKEETNLEESNEENSDANVSSEKTNSNDSDEENTDTNVSTEENNDAVNDTTVDGTKVDNTEDSVQDSDSIDNGEDQLATVASWSIQYLDKTEFKKNLPDTVTDIYFGTKTDYKDELTKCTGPVDLGYGYELYSNTDDTSESVKIFVVCENNQKIVFPEDSSYFFAKEEDSYPGYSTLKNIVFKNIDTSNVTNIRGMFYNCESLTSLDLSSFNTENVTNMREMFMFCVNLTSVDLSSFNTENVTDMCYMFYFCTHLTSLNLSSFNTGNVKYMNAMFCDCQFLTSLDVSNFNTENVIDMNAMFSFCCRLTSLDVSNFNTKNVKNMSSMFDVCDNLTSIDVSNFNTENVKCMDFMFGRCDNLTSIDVSNLNTENVTDMNDMFRGCKSLISLDLSSFNTENVDNMENMFTGCLNLKTIYTTNLFTAPIISDNMFLNCTNLIGSKGTIYNNKKTDYKYAHIDGGKDNPGYFSCKHTWNNGICTECGYICGHTWDSGVVTTEPTCENKGIKTFTCTKCNTTKAEDIAALGHSYTAEIIKTDALKTPGTCTDKAIYYKSCERCGQVDTDENNTFEGEVDSTNHNYSTEWTIDTPASCTQEGSESHHCTRCDAKTGDRPIAKTDHTWDSGVVTTEPTCENKGIKTFTCTKCNTTKTEDIAALGHELTHVAKKDATTEEFGNIEYWNCSKCKKNFKDSEGTNEITGSTVIPKLAPSIIKGDNQSVTEKEEKALSVTSNASYDDFIEVKVDGTTLDISKYTKVKGSTIITLNADYVSTLSVGTHTLDVVSKFGTATAHFKVEKKVEITPTPETNKSSTTDKTSNGWDDGGPFTTDKCGNVFDRWNNKIYEANGCNVGGYNLVRTSVED